MAITNEEKRKQRKEALALTRQSPKLEEMESFRINDRTIIYFKKNTPDDKIKERLSRHIKNMEHLDTKGYVPPEPIRTNNRKYE